MQGQYLPWALPFRSVLLQSSVPFRYAVSIFCHFLCQCAVNNRKLSFHYAIRHSALDNARFLCQNRLHFHVSAGWSDVFIFFYDFNNMISVIF